MNETPTELFEAPRPDAVLSELVRLFGARGEEPYGEDVSMSEHMRQTAHWAEREGRPPTWIAAALLHDVGHLLHDLPDDIADRGVDTRHEDAGAAWLESRGFASEVVEACRRHVDAKRYLCAVDPEYAAGLSDASRVSLALQGGPMSPRECETFAALPFAAVVLEIRRYDDRGKDDAIAAAPLEHFFESVRAALHSDPSREKRDATQA